MTTSVQRQFHRNGQLREAVPLRGGRRHGVVRTWHRNGVLASEERYREGLLHGVCRQWDAGGKLLGEFEMNRGTGVQREWHDNGRLEMEVSTVRGVFCGRTRIWLRDGTLLSERFYLRGQDVTADEYRRAAKLDATLPHFRGRVGRPLPEGSARRQRIHRVFVRRLLGKPNRREAAQWLRKKADDQTRRFLGRFKREADAAEFVEALYQAGAAEVIVADIYHDQRGNQFADALVVRLPKSSPQRRAVRAVGDKLRKQKLGAVEPETDIDERRLYLSLA
ncbi:MAG: hypothetical protein HYY24_16280 [Verrucomicrobia bacterium]|nr:hypothetical protein [Verrucomicrobiota bacterium]